jgi:U3 small nucleolar RNA-associated protein 15
MDFIKLQELPKLSSSLNESSSKRLFKSFKKRLEESCGAVSDVTAMSFSPSTDISQLAVACGSKVVLYDIGFGVAGEVCSWAKHKNLISCIAYRKDGKLLIAADGDGSANIYDVGVTKTIIRRLRGHDGAIYSTCFCGDGTRVVTAGIDQTVKVWDVPTGQILFTLKGHTDAVRCVIPIGENGILSGGADGQIIYWDITDGSQITATTHGCPIEKFALFDSGALFYSLGSGKVRLWDVRTMKEVQEVTPVRHTKPVTCAQVSDCGDFLATCSFDMTVKITQIKTGEVVGSFACESPVTSLAWRGDSICIGFETGKWIARQRRIEAEPVVAAPMIDQVALDSNIRYYSTKTIGSDASNNALKKQSTPDYLFRKYEYGKLVDFVLESNSPTQLSLAILDELIQRGGLQPALRGRTIEQLTMLVNWCTRNLVADPRCSVSIISQVVHALIEQNPRTIAQDELGKTFTESVKNLNNKIAQELTMQYRAATLVGLIESVMS